MNPIENLNRDLVSRPGRILPGQDRRPRDPADGLSRVTDAR